MVMTPRHPRMPKFKPTEQKIKIFHGGLTDVEIEFNTWRSHNDIKIDEIKTSSHSGNYVLTILYTQVKNQPYQDTDYELHKIMNNI